VAEGGYSTLDQGVTNMEERIGIRELAVVVDQLRRLENEEDAVAGMGFSHAVGRALLDLIDARHDVPDDVVETIGILCGTDEPAEKA
jgi:hypothetical protein